MRPECLSGDWQVLKTFSTPDISDALDGLYSLSHHIRHQMTCPPGRVVGPAFTVKLPPGDNLSLHQALKHVVKGDVLVVQSLAGSTAVCGDLLAHKLHYQGAAAVIIDGYIRDVPGFQTLDMPVYARGCMPTGPQKNGPGEINVPVACGMQVVMPGDCIVADEMGIVVIPTQKVEQVILRLVKQSPAQEAYREHVVSGAFNAQNLKGAP